MVGSLHKAVDIMFKPFQFSEEEYRDAWRYIKESSLSDFYKRYFDSMYADYVTPQKRLDRFSMTVNERVTPSYIGVLNSLGYIGKEWDK